MSKRKGRRIRIQYKQAPKGGKVKPSKRTLWIGHGLTRAPKQDNTRRGRNR